MTATGEAALAAARAIHALRSEGEPCLVCDQSCGWEHLGPGPRELHEMVAVAALEAARGTAARTFDLAEVKAAFWRTFHATGETWFNYLGTPDENASSTEDSWRQFAEALNADPQEPEDECE